MRISPVFLQQMVDHAVAEFPNECCGIVAAKDGEAVKVYPLTNSADDFTAVGFYEIDHQEQIDTLIKIIDQGWELGAIFHSHPRIEPYPSSIDVRLAGHDCLYVIIGLGFPEEGAEVRTFRIHDREITEVGLEVTGPLEGMILRPVLTTSLISAPSS